jgi:hypothetical protein
MNMRVYNGSQDSHFMDWLNHVPYDLALIGFISLPLYVSQLKDMVELIDYIYLADVLQAATIDRMIFKDQCLLTLLNRDVKAINANILRHFPGDIWVYMSMDSVDINEGGGQLDSLLVEYLQSLDPQGFPLAKLELKIGSPIILIRNILP